MTNDTTPQILCKCGCGQLVPAPKYPSHQNIYIGGHQPNAKRPIAERFWEKVKRGAPDECWEWQAFTDKNGYGGIQYKGRCYLAHRAAWELTHGPIPDGLFACHKCDNPRCCNPGHLFLGTHLDNSLDMVAKGRESRPNAKLTEGDVLEIRRLCKAGVPRKDIAQRFDVHLRTVGKIVRREKWKHIP